MKIAPSASRKGSVTHEEEVAVNLRSMAVALSIRFVLELSNYKTVGGGSLVRTACGGGRLIFGLVY
jgi:hypothetical protein